MLNKEMILKKAKKIMYEADTRTLEILEDDLTNLIARDHDPCLYITLARVFYEEKKYLDARRVFLEVLRFNNSSSIYLGLFKTYVALGHYPYAASYLNRYQHILGESINKCECSLLSSSLEAINSNLQVFTPVTNNDKYMYLNFYEPEALEIYQYLIENYNLKRFGVCIKLAERLQKYADEQNKFVEFKTLINLLKKLNSIKYQDLHNNQSGILKSLIEEENFEELLINLKTILNGIFTLNDTIIDSFKVLTINGYMEECLKLLDNVILVNSTKQSINHLKKIVHEFAEYGDLSDELKAVYQEGYIKGQYYLQMADYETAYDIFSWAYYLTGANIFLFYLGRVFYKQKNFTEANEYYQKYLEKGALKEANIKLMIPEKKTFTNNVSADEDRHKMRMSRKLRKVNFFPEQ